MIKKSEALHTIPPEDATWFIDGIALIRCLKPKNLKRIGFGSDQVHIPR